MENTPNLQFNEKREFTSKEDAIQKFFLENEIDKLTFDTREEAQSHVDKINREYGDISFVAEDRGGFAVKFENSHLGEGFKKAESTESDMGLDKAA